MSVITWTFIIHNVIVYWFQNYLDVNIGLDLKDEGSNQIHSYLLLSPSRNLLNQLDLSPTFDVESRWTWRLIPSLYKRHPSSPFLLLFLGSLSFSWGSVALVQTVTSGVRLNTYTHKQHLLFTTSCKQICSPLPGRPVCQTIISIHQSVSSSGQPLCNTYSNVPQNIPAKPCNRV